MYDEHPRRFRKTRFDRNYQWFVRILFWIAFLDIISWSFHASRILHFEYLPPAVWHASIALFLISSIRMNRAMAFGGDPYMDASSAWRNRKDLLEAYDFIGPEPDYSSPRHNIMFLSALLLLSIYLIGGFLHIDWLSMFSAMFNAILNALIAIAIFITPSP